MDELISWLHGVLDQDERHARQEIERARRAPAVTYETGSGPGNPAGDTTRWDSALADITAKRAIIEETIRPYLGMDTTTARVAAQALRLLASAYAARPGYRPEWTPG